MMLICVFLVVYRTKPPFSLQRGKLIALSLLYIIARMPHASHDIYLSFQVQNTPFLPAEGGVFKERLGSLIIGYSQFC